MHSNLIAKEMNKIGFQTKVVSSGVIVSLNRAMSRMEIEIALEQIFDTITFNITKLNNNSYLVEE